MAPTKGKKRARSSLPAKGTLKSLWQRQPHAPASAPAAVPAAAPVPLAAPTPPPPPAKNIAAAAQVPPPPAARAPARGGASAESSAASKGECKHIQLKDDTGNLRFWPSLLADTQASLFEQLAGIPDAEDPEDGRGWMKRPIKMAGREILQPRLTCSFGQEGRTYRYSGKTLRAAPWDKVSPIQDILAAVERAVGVGPGFFNYVLLNWYRDGTEYMGWHSDDEWDLESGAPIASVSLGQERTFQLRRTTNHSQKVELQLRGGSLLTMEGSTQKHWQHWVPKRTAKQGGTIQQVAGQTVLSWGKSKPSSADGSSSSRERDGTAKEREVLPPSTEGAEVEVGEVAAAAAAAAGGGKVPGRIATGRINLTFRRVKA